MGADEKPGILGYLFGRCAPPSAVRSGESDAPHLSLLPYAYFNVHRVPQALLDDLLDLRSYWEELVVLAARAAGEPSFVRTHRALTGMATDDGTLSARTMSLFERLAQATNNATDIIHRTAATASTVLGDAELRRYGVVMPAASFPSPVGSRA